MFPTSKWGLKMQRDKPLTATEHNNRQLLNKFCNRLCLKFLCIFRNVNNSIEKSDITTIKKVASNDLTAGMLNKKFKWEFKGFIAQGKFYEWH